MATKRRKFLSVLLGVCALVCTLVFGGVLLSSCGEKHEHFFEWKNNETGHWRECSCGIIVEENEHQPETPVTLTEGSRCKTCGYFVETDTGIKFNTMKVFGVKVFATVSSETSLFSFTDEITVQGGAEYEVRRSGENTPISNPSKATLWIGDNEFVVLEKIEGDVRNEFLVTIRRKPVYKVEFYAFYTNGEESEYIKIADSQEVEEGDLAVEPEQEAIIDGYEFIGWNHNFSLPITQSTVLMATWRAREDIKYTVNYYLQNKDGDYVLEKVDACKGTTGRTVTATIIQFPHCTYDKNISTVSGEVQADGSLTLDVYYTRNKYTLSVLPAGAGTLVGEGEYFGGEETFTASVTPHIGYTFWGWYSGTNLLSMAETFEFTSSKNVTARFKVDERLSDFWFTSTIDTCTIVQLKNYSIQELVIPDLVTHIGKAAFEYCGDLTSVVIGDGVTSIGDNAFYNCDSLTSVTIPNSKTSIGEYAFEDCEGLTSVMLGENVISIGTSAFASCVNLKKLTISNGLTLIGENAFKCCVRLTEVVIPESVTSIGKGAFHFCRRLTSVLIGNGVTSIGDLAFYYCDSLASVVIGDSVTSIKENAFGECYNLVEVVNKSPHITVTKGSTDNGEIGYYALDVYSGVEPFESKLSSDNGYTVYAYGDEKLLIGYTGAETDLVLPDYITKINQYAFYGCDNLQSVKIPDGVTSIGNSAFYGCSSLTSMVLPESVTEIGVAAFGWCKELVFNEYGGAKYLASADNRYFALIREIDEKTDRCIVHSDTKVWAKNAFADCDNLQSVVIEDGVTSIGNSAFSVCTNLTSVEIPDSVTSIGESAFYYCIGLTSIVIPDSVTSIGSYAFADCTGLTSIAISDSVTSIGEKTFAGCSNLTSIAISDSVTSIGNNAFKDCSSLMSIVIPDGVMTIGNSAFYGCNSLKSIVIPDSVVSIGESAFYGCEGLTSVVIGDGVTSIGRRAFHHCRSLESVVIGDGATSIGEYAFSGYNRLKSVVLGGGAKIIGEYAFYHCDDLQSVVLGDGLTSIGNSAFAGCSSLTSIVIPDSVTEIDEYAFYSCVSLTSVVIGDSVTSIGEYAFDGCDSLQSVVIPDSVISIGYFAFSYCDSLQSVVIGDGVTTIGRCAFYHCFNLTSVVIGGSVTSIGDYAFNGCGSREGVLSVYYEGAASEWSSISIGSSNSNLTHYAKRYYYSETEPALNADGTAYDGNYWHYAADGATPVVWTYREEQGA